MCFEIFMIFVGNKDYDEFKEFFYYVIKIFDKFVVNKLCC